MLKTMLLVIATLISVMLTSNDFSLAQTGSETDPRFEKLAKDLYPKARGRLGRLYYLGCRAYSLHISGLQQTIPRPRLVLPTSDASIRLRAFSTGCLKDFARVRRGASRTL